jgi:hypothetical protein
MSTKMPITNHTGLINMAVLYWGGYINICMFSGSYVTTAWEVLSLWMEEHKKLTCYEMTCRASHLDRFFVMTYATEKGHEIWTKYHESDQIKDEWIGRAISCIGEMHTEF